MARAFFRDLQEWEWTPRRFGPARALGVWATLLWAGLHLEAVGLPQADGRVHPVEMIRAITLTWPFSGQRSDEIPRQPLPAHTE